MQLNSRSHIGWFLLGFTACSPCVRLKNAMKGISAKTLEHKEFDHQLIYIWNQYNLGNVLSTCI